MIKNIIIGIFIFLSIFFVVLANIKANEAEKQVVQAMLNLELAKENEAKAKMEEQRAVEAAANARIFERKIEELQAELDNCKN